MELSFQQRFLIGNDRFDVDLRDLEILQTSQGSWLYASTGRNGGISQFQLSGGGAAPVLIDTHWHQRSTLATGEFSLTEIGGDPALLQHDTTGGRLLSYAPDVNGNLGTQQQQSLPGGINALEDLTGARLGTGTELIYGVSASGRLTGWRVAQNGTLEARVATSGAAEAFQLPETAALTVSEAARLLFVADGGLQGVQSYRINAQTGALTAADHFGAEDGLPVADPSALQSFQAYGATWLALAAAGTGSLSLFQVNGRGGLRLTDHLNDTLTTRFGGASVLEVVKVEDHVLVLAAGADDGLSLLRLLPSGQLVHVTSLAHEVGLGLQNVTALTTAVVGDQLEIFLASETALGLSHLRLDLGGLGVVAQTRQGRLTGGSGDDLLQGGTGAVNMSGGQGDDVLVARGGGSNLTGGNGADIFVLGAVDGVLRVRDFRSGVDSLDLSLMPGLRSPGQLQVTDLDGGIRLSFGETRVLIWSATGQDLTLDDLWPEGQFSTPDRVPQGVTLEDGTKYGSGDADELLGQADADHIQGLGGDDMLRGWGGADTLNGGDGADRLLGDAGADRLLGEAGNDALMGGAGWDWLYGGAGEDLLKGGTGGDRLFGELGADSLYGEAGNDSLYGGAGHDDLWGGLGDDRLFGQGGSNRLFGQGGADSLTGGSVADWLFGGFGDDQLHGKAGHDQLRGDAGNDSLFGDNGRDSLFGGGGDDFLHGGAGHDRLFGRAGNDTLQGGNGKDLLQGNRGQDLMVGGGGADVFVFAPFHGHDRIQDFNPNEDRINLTALGGQNFGFDDLQISRSGGDTLIRTPAGQILLEDILPRHIQEDDFLF